MRVLMGTTQPQTAWSYLNADLSAESSLREERRR